MLLKKLINYIAKQVNSDEIDKEFLKNESPCSKQDIISALNAPCNECRNYTKRQIEGYGKGNFCDECGAPLMEIKESQGFCSQCGQPYFSITRVCSRYPNSEDHTGGDRHEGIF